MDSSTVWRPRVVDVYPYRLAPAGVPEWLLLRRSPDVLYAGSWRMVGGKVMPGEPGWRAALRELLEETGRQPVRAWTLPSVNAFYEWQSDRLTIAPAFAAELDADPVVNRESTIRSAGCQPPRQRPGWHGPSNGDSFCWPTTC